MRKFRHSNRVAAVTNMVTRHSFRNCKFDPPSIFVDIHSTESILLWLITPSDWSYYSTTSVVNSLFFTKTGKWALENWTIKHCPYIRFIVWWLSRNLMLYNSTMHLQWFLPHWNSPLCSSIHNVGRKIKAIKKEIDQDQDPWYWCIYLSAIETTHLKKRDTKPVDQKFWTNFAFWKSRNNCL